MGSPSGRGSLPQLTPSRYLVNCMQLVRAPSRILLSCRGERHLDSLPGKPSGGGCLSVAPGKMCRILTGSHRDGSPMDVRD